MSAPELLQQHLNDNASHAGTDADRSPEQIKADDELADRLSRLIENANEKVVPLTKTIRRHIENMKAKKEEDRNEQELVDQVRPLLEQAEKILNETYGGIKGADPDNRLSSKAKRNADAHKATPSEQRLAASLKILLQEVGETIEWAKGELDAFPKAKKDLGPLLEALGQPLTQIVGAVGLLLAGVLNLVANLLSALGLDGLLWGIVGALGLDKIYNGLGFGKMLNKGGT